jgi:mono/diheme cytochrome c family protein
MKQTFILALGLILVACSSTSTDGNGANSTANSPTGMGPGMGMQGGMMARHQAPIPEEYKGLTNPIPADEDSLERGGELFTTYCASCHGDGGMGDGPASAALDPAPVAIAHTSQMMGDDYLFWRVSEGGAMDPFNSGMPAWANTLDEQARWDVLNYVQALGSGTVMPHQGMGGAAYDPAVELEQRATMLTTAIEQEVITQAEANLFTEVHTFLDAQMTEHRDMMSGSMADMQATMLAQLVSDGTITQAQAAAFNDIHDRLMEAGLMQ